MSYICEKIVLSENGKKEYFIDNDGVKTITFDEETLSTMIVLGFDFENLDTESGWMPNVEKLKEMMMIRESFLKYKHLLNKMGKPNVVFTQVKDDIITGIKTREDEDIIGLPITVRYLNTAKTPCIKLTQITEFHCCRFNSTEIPCDVFKNQKKVDKFIKKILLCCLKTYKKTSKHEKGVFY